MLSKRGSKWKEYKKLNGSEKLSFFIVQFLLFQLYEHSSVGWNEEYTAFMGQLLKI